MTSRRAFIRQKGSDRDQNIRSGGIMARIMFLIWPFSALVYGIFHIRSSWSKNILWLFVAFFGFTFVISNTGLDANRYRDKLLVMTDHDFTLQTLSQQMYRDTEYLDILQPVTTFVVSRFTDDYRILFAVFGILFGYFYSRNIWFLLDRAEGKIRWYGILLVATFSILVGFWQINGFRFWTAVQIFVFGILHYLEHRKTSHMLVAISSIFVHFSFFFPVLAFFLYLLAGNRVHLFFYIYVITFFFSEASLTQVREYLSFVPSIFEAKVNTYTSEVYAEVLGERRSSLNWYVQYYGDALRYTILVWMSWIYFTGRIFITQHRLLSNLFSFTLLMYALANLGSLIPSGNRFIILSNMFAVTLIFWYVHANWRPGWLRRIALISVPALLLYIVVSFRVGMDMMGTQLLIGNPITAIVSEDDSPLIELIK